MENVYDRIHTIHQRFRQLSPWNQRRLIGAAILAPLLSFVAWNWHQRYTPEYALSVVNSIETRDDVARHREYLTDQGAKVVLHVLQLQSGPSTGGKAKIGSCQVRGNICYVPISQGQTAGYFEFQRDGVWKLNDIVITRHNGRDIRLSISYSIDHPILASLQTADWSSLLQSFVSGFLFGMSQGNH